MRISGIKPSYISDPKPPKFCERLSCDSLKYPNKLK